MRRTKDKLEKDRQPPEKMFIFGKSFINKLKPSAYPPTGFHIERIMMPYAFDKCKQTQFLRSEKSDDGLKISIRILNNV